MIFLGLKVAGPEEEVRLIKGLQMKFNLTSEKAESLLQRVPIVVKKSVSREEMERYVKAFEEIGGRVRIEEEPVVEPLEISQRPAPGPEPEKELHSGKKMICPQCGFEQPEADRCTRCGIVVSNYFHYQEMDRSDEGKVREISSGGEYAPWENGEGFIRAFLKTTQQALFSPTRFFKKVSAGEGYGTPLIYGMISGIIGFGGAILWQWFFFSKWLPVRRFLNLPYNFYWIITIALPVMAAFSILIESGVTHFCLTIVGGNKKGFGATFRAISYSFCGYLFGILPLLGSPIGGIYKLILTVIGVREGHEISTGKAVLAIFLPVIVGVGLTILLAILIPLFLGMMGFSRGVKV